MRIIHVLRTPVGGLFRHVCDLAREQSRSGHAVGVICDADTGGDDAQTTLALLQPACSLGIHRFPMRRLPHPSDIRNSVSVSRIAKQNQAEILHGHGAKGGLYARLSAPVCKAKSVYTPHGGSLHYTWSDPTGFASLATEKFLKLFGKNFIFVCDFEKRLFDAKIGIGTGRFKIVQNGLNENEFLPVTPDDDATDFLFVGEMRSLKGVDLLLEAVATIPSATLTLVGDGPDQVAFEELCSKLSLTTRSRFLGRMPMREAMTKGVILVVPSRNEAFPYVVLEGLAASRIVLATDVGGIPEILDPQLIFETVSHNSINEKLRAALHNFDLFARIAAQNRAKVMISNSSRAMSAAITGFYKILLDT